MKKIIAIVAALFIVVEGTAQTTQGTTGTIQLPISEDRSLNPDGQSIMLGGQLTEVNMEYYEKLGGQRHDQLVMTTSDGVTYWKAQTIDGFHLGAVAGGSLHGLLGGVMFGYSGKTWSFDVTAKYGRHQFKDESSYAPSAFLTGRRSLLKFGKLEEHQLYAGLQLGYQWVPVMNSYREGNEEDGYIFDYKSRSVGSGLAYGACLGWEKRNFMSGHRIGIEASAYTYETKFTANSHTEKWRGVVVEAKFIWRFVFHKKARNY